MAKAEKKTFGLLPKSLTSVLLGGLAVTVILAFIWSWVMNNTNDDVNPYNRSWLTIIEFILLAVLIGVAVGILGGAVKPVYLWIAAGLAIVGFVVTNALMSSSMVPWDAALLGSLGQEAFGVSVSVGSVVLAIVGASSVGLGLKTKL